MLTCALLFTITNSGNDAATAHQRYSVGSQMVSWFIQLHASGQLESLHLQAPSTVTATLSLEREQAQHVKTNLVAGVMFAGGTYGFFLDPPLAMSQCSSCNASLECTTLGCSNTMVAKNITPCCNYCCPTNYTEQWYADHPEDYSKHPEVFMVQVSRQMQATATFR